MVVVFALNAVVTTWAAIKIWGSSRRALVAAVVLAATVPATGLIGLNRFDATVGLVIALTVLCLAYRRWALAALFVGLGFSLKLMPIVLLPLVFVLARRWRFVWRAGLAALVGMVVPFVPFLIQGGSVHLHDHGERADGSWPADRDRRGEPLPASRGGAVRAR